MDTFSSNSKDDSLTKTRKPYTITKQRERWTTEEHNRFLEAIKLYGRAWQNIEEHIGTKTAVQIRSHAQKFFSKVEKEAVIKGVPLGQSRDIDIPPPRPKRKPNNPYPRKSSAGTPNSIPVEVKDGNHLKTASSLHSGEQILDLENGQHVEKPSKRTRTTEDSDEGNSSGILSLSQETPCSCFSPASKSPPESVVLNNQCVFRRFIPLVKETSDKGVTVELFENKDLVGNQKSDKADGNDTDLDDGSSRAPNLNKCFHNLDKKVVKGVKLKQPENLCLLPKEEIQSNQNYPRHIPVHVVECSSETCTESPYCGTTCPTSIIHQVEGTFGNANDLANSTASGTTENHSNITIQQLLPNFPSLLNRISNDEDSYNMFVNTTFSNLIVSTLLQNPAAHAAASFAASFWPFTNVKTPVDSLLGTIEGFQLRPGAPSPSASAIASATVMAASAWWAAHGLLPLCPPLHALFACIPAPINPSPVESSPVLVEKERNDQRFAASPQQLDTGLSRALEPKLPDSKLPPLPFADCRKNVAAKSSTTGVETPGQEQKAVSMTGFNEFDKGKIKEQVDRSSCGSNTPSSSEVEMDMLEKCADGNDETKELNANQWTSEPNNQRSRSMGNMNEYWKEVSQEGKLAFKALFTRQVLPQSFSPPKCLWNNGQLITSFEEGIHKSDETCEGELQVELNSKTLSTLQDCQETEKGELPSQDKVEPGVLFMGCGHGKLKARRMGFKPYKRCSVEAKESSKVTNESNQCDERDLKRVCLEGEDLT